MQKPDLFIFSGEHSGDMHGAGLVHALKKRRSNLKITGVPGPQMREEGVEPILTMENFEVMGFTDVIKAFPKIWKQFRFVRDSILHLQPKVTILIDYTTFNLRMAKALRKKGYTGKIIQYISPSFWAWGEKRMITMIENLDLLLTIYPFEAESFKNSSLKALYVGNPTSEKIYSKKMTDKSPEPLIGIFPGSRKSEVQRNLPKMLETIALIPDIPFAVSCASKKLRPLIEPILTQHQVPLSAIRTSDFHPTTALAVSGTMTLELALRNIPTVVVYDLSKINRWFGKYILKLNLKHFCMVNILADQEVFPEFIEKPIIPELAAIELKKLHNNKDHRQQCLFGCEKIRQILDDRNVNETAALAIERLIYA